MKRTILNQKLQKILIQLRSYTITICLRIKKKLINTNKHFVLETGHPSPLSANRGYWFGNKQFSKTNSLLEQADLEPIHWDLS